MNDKISCSVCKLASSCNVDDGKGTKSEMTPRRAILVGFGLPFVLMVAVLVITLCLTGNETTAALMSVLTLVPYYFVIHIYSGYKLKQNKKL